MRKFLCLIVLHLVCTYSFAQIVVDYESLQLPSNDTEYVNYAHLGRDNGFDVSGLHHPCVYDSLFGGRLWYHGFAYSNRTNPSGYPNLYSAQPLSGHNNSHNYVVVNGLINSIKINNEQYMNPYGVYVTNNTFTYHDMIYGNAYVHKFGDTNGTKPDWLRLEIKGYYLGHIIKDSIEYYLADLRSSNSADDYIADDWRFVRLFPIGSKVDSITFTLSSSVANSSGLGIPAFFCIDDLTFWPTRKEDITDNKISRVFPNPTHKYLNIELLDPSYNQLSIWNTLGQCIHTTTITNSQLTLNVSYWPPGEYILQFNNGEQSIQSKFQKL